MKNKVIFLLLYGILVTFANCQSKDTINFFFKPYPPNAESFSLDKAQQLVSTPGKLSRYLFKHYLSQNSITGICCSYMGYFAVSSYNGLVEFPRKQANAQFTIIVTPIVKPIIMLGNTVHHLELLPGKPAQLYSANYTEDSTTRLWYWKIEPLESLNNNIVPLHAILIFADPQTIYVPQGITPVTKQLQIVLPDIYTKKQGRYLPILSSLINIKQFFKAVSVITHDVNKTITESLIND